LIPGIVTVGRPVRPGIELPPLLERLKQVRLERIAEIKDFGGIATADVVEVDPAN
jgi:hypothetical protein